MLNSGPFLGTHNQAAPFKTESQKGTLILRTIRMSFLNIGRGGAEDAPDAGGFRATTQSAPSKLMDGQLTLLRTGLPKDCTPPFNTQ